MSSGGCYGQTEEGEEGKSQKTEEDGKKEGRQEICEEICEEGASQGRQEVGKEIRAEDREKSEEESRAEEGGCTCSGDERAGPIMAATWLRWIKLGKRRKPLGRSLPSACGLQAGPTSFWLWQNRGFSAAVFFFNGSIRSWFDVWIREVSGVGYRTKRATKTAAWLLFCCMKATSYDELAADWAKRLKRQQLPLLLPCRKRTVS